MDAGEVVISETFVYSSFLMHPANITVDAIGRVIKVDTGLIRMVTVLKIFIT